MAEPVSLIVDGLRYGGWKGIRITQSIENLAGSFTLEANDRWGENEGWPIAEGDACQVQIGDQTVVDGYVDSVDLGGDANGRTLSYEGRDKTQDLVDCSVLVQDTSTKGNKWTYRNIDIAAFAAAIAKPHGISVKVSPGLTLKKDPLLVAHPGETGFEAIKRAAASAGVLVVSDGQGGILITQSGTSRATSLREGENIKSGKTTRKSTDRFYRYLVSSQPPASDEESGEDLRVQGEATDLDVKRKNRTLVIRPEKGYNREGARRRADWEARIRAAKAQTANVTVQGWTQQPNGELWKANSIVNVFAPWLLRIDGDMLISQVEFSVGDGGTITQLSLTRTDAFVPEPQAVVSGDGAWIWQKQFEKGTF